MPDRVARLPARGLLTLDELAAVHGVTGHTALKGHRRGLLVVHGYNDRAECLFEPPGSDAPGPRAWKFHGLQRTAYRLQKP